MKNNMVIMDFAEFTKLEPRTLAIMNNSEAILTNLPKEDADVKELYKRIVDIFHEDARKPKKEKIGYVNLLETVVIFVADDMFPDFNKPLEDLQSFAVKSNSSGAQIKGPLGQLLNDLK